MLPGLQFVHTMNRGVAFGFLTGNIAIAVALIGLALVRPARCISGVTSGVRSWASHGPLVGGALSNILDRVRIGSVTDFIQLPLGWPPFNLADAAITFGVLSLALVIEDGARHSGSDSPPRDSRGEASARSPK